MSSLLDYLEWRGDLTFLQSPFNPVDNLIMSLLSYFPFDGLVPGPEERGRPFVSLQEAAGRIFEKYGGLPRGAQLIPPQDGPEMLRRAAASRRFGQTGITGYVNHVDPDREVQFCALALSYRTARGPEGYLAFRGTDDTLVGWKEDFYMSFKEAIPAQLEAVAYVQKTARRLRGKLRLGGHSKGGNLAAYGGAFCGARIQRRIAAVYRNDAPGFNLRVLESPGYQAVRNRIHSFIPQTSVVGMLFENDDNYAVVKSRQSGLMQHDAYSWEVGPQDLVRLEKVTTASLFVDRTLKEWLAALEPRQLKEFVDALFQILSSTGVSTWTELSAGWLKNALTMLRSLNTMDRDAKARMEKIIRSFLKAAARNFVRFLP
ncbi:MAG: DUF2974 domain-containing protein [Spirochaetales bacterium]|jgi:hypothetical protein|nr:DUF2974 domain-containing protein [Spirochaetales bacterium]